MKRVSLIGAAVVLLLVAASTAWAVNEAQNVYKVDVQASPNSTGSAKKPAPVGVKFGFQVTASDNNRPYPVKKYTINLPGIKTNSKFAKVCSADTINSHDDDSKCPKGSQVGSGTIINDVGVPNNRVTKQLYCYLDIRVYAGGKNKAALFLKGSQFATDPKKACAVGISEAIPARWIKGKNGGQSLTFDVPDNLLHPAGLDNAIRDVKVNLPRKVVHGLSYLNSVSCAKGGRVASIKFTLEDGSNQTVAGAPQKCKK